MEIKDIMIGKRHRTTLGDIGPLKRSISEVGLLQPIVVKKGTNELVAGFRRLKALEELGVTELTEGTHVNLIDIESIIRGEHDENTCRLDFTISEKVAIFEALKEERKRINVAHQIVPEKVSSPSGFGPAPCSPEKDRGQRSARSHAAEAVGLHYNTLRKASEIISAARHDPVRYDRLVREMDTSGKVEPVFQKYMREKSQPAAAPAREWVFLPRVRQVAAVMMSVAKAKGPASALDKLDFFMTGLAGFVDMACSYLRLAKKDGILKDIPPDALEKYLAAIDAFQMLYESKLPREVGALRGREAGPMPGNGVPTIRDHVNAMKANEMITNAAEGSVPYYRDLLAGLVQNFRKGAQSLEETRGP